jgi:pyridoxine kinase
VRPGIPEFMRDRAVPAADIATPNQFELEWLTGGEVTTLDDAKAAIATLQASGPALRAGDLAPHRRHARPTRIELLAGEATAVLARAARRCCR